VRGYGTNGGDLDVRLSLVDASGATVASSGAPDQTDATVTASVPAGTYFLRVAADSSNYASIYGSEGQYTISGSVPEASSVPSASLETTPTAQLGTTTSTFDVSYFDLDGIDAASLGIGDIRVTGPNGFSQLVAFVGLKASGPVAKTATYRIAAPGGTWDSADNGTYAIAVNGSQVSDTAGNSVPGGSLGSFAVALQRKVLYNATMTTNPGWVLTEAWAYGVPTASSGPTDRPVIGDTITGTGLYADGNRATTATTPAFSTTGMSNVTFSADTMVGIRSDDVASIDIGVGSKWTTIWSNNGQTLVDAGWLTRAFDISSIAANKPSVQIRFVLGPTKQAPAKVNSVSFGWNVGSLQVTGR
jgi:hypothetical protein